MLRICNSHFVVIHIFFVIQYSTINQCCVFTTMISFIYDHQVAPYAHHFTQVGQQLSALQCGARVEIFEERLSPKGHQLFTARKKAF